VFYFTRKIKEIILIIVACVEVRNQSATGHPAHLPYTSVHRLSKTLEGSNGEAAELQTLTPS
jgi:hypothetical protein